MFQTKVVEKTSTHILHSVIAYFGPYQLHFCTYSAAFFFYWHWLWRFGLDGRSIGLYFVVGAKILLFSLFPRPPLRRIQPPVPVGVGLSSGVNRAGPWKWQLSSMKRQDQECVELHLHFSHMHGNSDAPRYVLFSIQWYFMPAVWDYY